MNFFVWLIGLVIWIAIAFWPAWPGVRGTASSATSSTSLLFFPLASSWLRGQDRNAVV